MQAVPSTGPLPSFPSPAEPAGPRTIGHYLVSPLIRKCGNGWFAGCVSIRSGPAAGAIDRVLRLTRLFRCANEAAAYAHAEALQWIRATPGPAFAA